MLDKTYTCTCGRVHVEMSYKAPFGVDRLIENSIKKMHEKKLQAGDIDADLFRANAKKIYEGVKAGATKDGVQGPGSNLSQNMLYKLKLNSYTAAAFKQYKNNLEIAALLTDENGKRRSFAEFSKLAKPLMETFNKTHLQREYTLALRSSQSAAKWATYEARGGKIRYRTVGDANVRDDHRLLDGTIKPVNDPFWNNHFPPNGWGCRCGTSWVSDDTPDVEPQGAPDIPPPFQNNPGKTGHIFNPAHPYFADVDDAIAIQLSKIASKEADINIVDLEYNVFETPNGNKYEVHSTHKGEAFLKNKPIVEFLIDTLKLKVKLLPDNTVDRDVWKKIMPKGTKEGKHPDALIGKNIWEFKTLESASKNAIKRNIGYAYEQADNILLRIDHNITYDDLYRYVKGEILASKSIKNVWVWNKGVMIKFNRNNTKKPHKD